MKTRAKSLIKAILMVTLISTVMISCGKDNKSGSSSNPTGGVNPNDPWSGGATNSQLPSNWINTLYSEYPCNTNYNGTGAPNNTRVRIPVQANGNININVGSIHVGVTLEGDILMMTNTNGGIISEVHACQRPAMENSAQFIQQPILEMSETCAMSQTTAADIYINTQYGPYHLAFFPAGLSAPSSLCRN